MALESMVVQNGGLATGWRREWEFLGVKTATMMFPFHFTISTYPVHHYHQNDV
jgi:hypothetical protein